MNTGILITIGIFMAGVIFGAGRLTARTEKLEAWQLRMEEKIDRLCGDVSRLLAMAGESHDDADPEAEGE